jgi:hypothetical protein
MKTLTTARLKVPLAGVIDRPLRSGIELIGWHL